jgi:hypothetical protein
VIAFEERKMPTPAYNVPSPTMLDVFPTTPKPNCGRPPRVQYHAVADFKVWQFECRTAKQASLIWKSLAYQAKKSMHDYRIMRSGCVVTFQRIP